MASSTPAARFDALVAQFAGDPDVTPPEVSTTAAHRFGANGLKVKGKIFAMLSRDQLVVKLPRQRVDALVGDGQGERMVSGGGRKMQEWLVVASDSRVDWQTLAREARGFVGPMTFGSSPRGFA